MEEAAGELMPSKQPYHIDEVYAFVGDNDEGEGIMAFLDTTSGYWVPMVAADRARVQKLAPLAASMAEAAGKTYRLVRFTTREELDAKEFLDDG